VQPFRNYTVNPAELVVRALKGAKLSEDARRETTASDEDAMGDERAESPPPERRRRPVEVVRADVVPTSYARAGAHVASLHEWRDESGDALDLVVHVGVGWPGALALEHLARRSPPYVSQDVDCELPSDGAVAEHLACGAPATLTSTCEVESVVAQVASGSSTCDVRSSTNAGAYVCEHTFFCSLAAAAAHRSGARVQFVHIPP